MKHSKFHRVIAGTIIDKPCKAIVIKPFFVKAKYGILHMKRNKHRGCGAFNKHYGYLVTSNISLAYDFASTRQEAVRRYLETLVQDILWYREDKAGLSKRLLLELASIEQYIQLVEDIEQENAEWKAIVAQPHVMNALRPMARKVMERDAAGECEEGGFGGDEEQKHSEASFENAMQLYKKIEKRYHHLFQDLADM
jgi:hypothetical protein